VTIAHAEALAEAFNRAGHRAAAVHSDLAKEARRGVLARFESGELKTLVNVGVLTEGWDSPKVDCVLMCRPTKSPGLFVQMLGRGTRLCEGKNDLLVLDLAENFNRHGDPSNPAVRIGKPSGKIDDLSETPFKTCPNCLALVPLAMRICPDCCHRFAPEEKPEAKNAPEMVEIRQSPANRHRIKSWTLEPHVSMKGQEMCVLKLSLEDTHLEPSCYMCFSKDAHPFFRSRSIRTWRQLAGTGLPLPKDAAEAVAMAEHLVLPQVVTLFKDKKDFLKVKEFG
jgi:DNA repair protein RadD